MCVVCSVVVAYCVMLYGLCFVFLVCVVCLLMCLCDLCVIDCVMLDDSFSGVSLLCLCVRVCVLF